MNEVESIDGWRPRLNTLQVVTGVLVKRATEQVGME